ncbi:MAG: penicillin acylase family protein [Chloroflexi bacterium]|nr:penicillin acylase family protein [Chloroflexota bacterium]
MTSLASLRLAAGFAPGILRAKRSAAGTASHPRVAGHPTAAGLDAPIEVLRDRHGVPHVFARTEADALFGQGYVHAQDRLFQLESMRRTAAGRLAEFGGQPLVEGDRFMRRLGLARRAALDVAAAAPAELALLQAYALGVNAGIEAQPELPPEFALLGVEPAPWTPLDTMLIGRLLMFSFASNWESELLRDHLHQSLGPDRAALLDPAYGTHRATQTGQPYPGSAERLLHAYHRARAAGLPAGAASNAWAVAPQRSKTGYPLLASDPHVEVRIPSLFHVTHLQGGAIDAIGADVPGVPGIAIGHTQSLAWGLTAGLADVADCFIETIDPDRPDHYRTPAGWQPADRRVERIAVRDAAPIDEVVLETRHGPIIEPAAPGTDRAIALRCTALEEGDLAGPFLGLLAAHTVEDFQRALDGWHGSTFGFVFAHIEGTIGQRLAGAVPRRAPGDGLLPTDGARSPGPAPVRPPHELPSVIDPPGGYVVAANNAPGADPALGEEWCEPWRAERIAALLAATDRHDVATFEAIQRDQHSAPMSALRDLLLTHAATPPTANAVTLDLLRSWDGHLAPDSTAAAIVQTTYRTIARDLLERLGGTQGLAVIGESLVSLAAQTSFDYRLQGWVLDQLRTPRLPAFATPEERDRMLRGALVRALDEPAATTSSFARPNWGARHPIAFNHVFSSIPLIGDAFSRGSRPVGGDINTVWQTSQPISSNRAPRMVAPAYRQVIDLADFDRSTFQLATGNSGIPGHRRYDDCIDDYLAGQSRPLLYSRATIEAATEHTLTIAPGATAASEHVTTEPEPAR